MLLKSVDVQCFRNIINSNNVVIENNITCLVGKNESGKTAFLHALYRLNPSRTNVSFSIPDQYPAWLEKKDRMQGKVLESITPINAVFSFSDKETKEIEEIFGEGFINCKKPFTINMEYSGKQNFIIESHENYFVANLINKIDWPKGTKTDATKCKTISELKEYSEKIRINEEYTVEQKAVSSKIVEVIQNSLQGKTLDDKLIIYLKKIMPKFLYMSEYSTLPYSVQIQKLLTTDQSQLNDKEITAKALLNLAAADKDYLINPDYERRKRELENVANALTQDVLKYWTQNPELRVLPDITLKTINEPSGRTSVVDELKIRIWDQRHQLSLPFNEHSTGFQWFFSFLAAFSEYEYRNDSIIILLDEPALGLHAKAQADFLRFIEDRLAKKCQVIYTTHSPFMIQPGKLERVRLVEDKGQELGTIVSKDVTTTDADTLFPLQGALGYDLVQNLFIAPNNLIVEGTSDFTYLQVISDYFKNDCKREFLNEKWSFVPVGGVDLVPTFVALLGNHLDVTVVIDSQKGGNQKLRKIVEQGILKANKIITIGAILRLTEADIEDLFDPKEYLELYNIAFSSNIMLNELNGSDPIVRKIARHLGIERFDHGKPADLFLRKRDEILPRLSNTTLDHFELLFKEINKTLI